MADLTTITLVGILIWLSLYSIGIFVLVIVPAAFGISTGFKEVYVKWLLALFEWGQQRIETRNLRNVATYDIIDRKPSSPNKRYSLMENEMEGKFRLEDSCEFIKSGIEAIIEDEVTKRFDAAELPSWNLLTRTNLNYQFVSWRLTLIWVVGGLVRYFFFLPVRLTIAICGGLLLVVSTAMIPRLPLSSRRKRWLSKWTTLFSFRILSRGLSAVINFHNPENRAKGGGLCVANHTSPIDAIFLSCDRNYALIGQMQGGIMGFMQKTLLKVQDHIFFERSEMKDRALVVQRMREHVADEQKNPILIFPEGTCINNTSVMMFKKGSFEVGGTIYPVAIKYDPTFGNPFWNSMKEPMLQYLINIFTSWAIVGDVWYMPPTTIQEGETAIEFANRVKHDIALQGGLVDLVWDGGLKRAAVPEKLIEKQQKDFASRHKIE